MLDVFEGKKHDISIFRGGFTERMQLLNRNDRTSNTIVYGDPEYQMCRYVMAPYKGIELSNDEINFRTTMAQYRIIVEWAFGKVINEWACLDYNKKLNLFLKPVAKYYEVGVLLSNFRSCMYSNQSIQTFEVPVPSLAEYLNKQQ